MKLVAANGVATPLNRPRLTIGRDPSSDLIVADPAVSSAHAVIEQDARGFLLRDAGSTNGTFVNGLRLTDRCRLQPGDVVEIGGQAWRVQADAPPAGGYGSWTGSGGSWLDPAGRARASESAPASARAAKDAHLALVIEAGGGVLACPGLGWIYAGESARGALTLGGTWLWILSGVLLAALLWPYVLCATAAGWLALVAWSVLALRAYAARHPERLG